MVLAFDGWNDAGEAATTAVRCLETSLRSVDLAEIDSEEFFDFTVCRPRVLLDAGETRRLEWPRCEFRFGELDAGRELVTGVGAEPHLRWRSFADCVSLLTNRLGIRRVVLLGAYLAEVVYSRPVEVSGFATDPKELERLEVERSGYEGPTGIVGVLADRLQHDGLEVLSLWAGLPHYLNASPNPRGALALLDKLAAHLGTKVDDSELRDSVADFERRVSEIVNADPELAEYVRQLKRRDFAQ